MRHWLIAASLCLAAPGCTGIESPSSPDRQQRRLAAVRGRGQPVLRRPQHDARGRPDRHRRLRQELRRVCHSTITSASDGNHAAAVASAKSNIEDLIFTSAARVDQQGTISTTSAVPFNGSTPTFSVGGACPTGDVGLSPQVQVVGVCKHPGCSTATTTRSRTASR